MLISDGAPAFRKATDQLIEDVIPPAITEEFKQAIFFNTFGSIQRTCMGGVINYIGKRSCERAKELARVMTGYSKIKKLS